MSKFKNALAVMACAALVAACGGGSETADTTVAAPEAVTSETSTTSAAPETTSTTPAETTIPSTTVTSTTESTAPTGATGGLDVIRGAMSQTVDSQPARVEGQIIMSGVDLGTDGETVDVEMPFTVATDISNGNSSMVMDFAAMAAAMSGEEGLDAAMAEMMGSMEIRQIDDTVYLQFPFFTAFMGAETPWVSMPAEEGDDVTGSFGTGANPTAPADFLEAFENAEGTVEELGPEDVRGIATTRYRVVLDDSWQEALTDEQLEGLDDQASLPASSFPMDLWIDGDGLVHRMAMDVQGDDLPDAEDEFESMQMVFDFFGFGETIAIEAPPADQVTDVEDLSGLFGGGTTP